MRLDVSYKRILMATPYSTKLEPSDLGQRVCSKAVIGSWGRDGEGLR